MSSTAQVNGGGKYQSLSGQFDHLLKRSARFVRMAFHVHSPQSYDWGARPGADAVRNEPTQYLNAGESAFLDTLKDHFDIVCITDHMRAEYACSLARAARTRGDIVVFPGMEINCVLPPVTRKVHLLAIFPPEKSIYEIERIFAHQSDFPGDNRRTGQEDFHAPSLVAFKEIVQSQGGILIVAHIDESSRGHRARFRAMRDETLRLYLEEGQGRPPVDAAREISDEYACLLADAGVDAVEIMRPSDRGHYVSLDATDGSRVRIPCVVRSDPHCVEEFNRVETTTYVKVSRPDFACVRDALRFHETRVRFKDDLPDAIPNRIVGVRLVSPSGAGLFGNAIIAFNQNLNTLIGPRGSGKSTVIEAIRYALGQNNIPSEEVSERDASFDYRAISQKIQKANLKDTLIEVVYERDGVRHCLSCAFDEKAPGGTEVFDLDGSPRLVNSTVLPAEFPVRIYSWSEIENLGRLPSLQRELLDRLIPELPEIRHNRESEYSRLKENGRRLLDVASQLGVLLSEERGVLRRFVEYKADFERVNTPEMAALFETVDDLRERISVLQSVREHLATRRESAESMVEDDAAAVAAILDKVESAALQHWWAEEIAVSVNLNALDAELSGAAAAAISAFDTRIAVLDERLVPMREQLGLQEALLREGAHASPEEELTQAKREQARKRWESVSARRDAYIKQLARFDELLNERSAIVERINVLQQAISDRRKSSQDQLLARLADFGVEDMRIGASFGAGQDRGELIAFLRDTGVLTRDVFGQYKDKAVAERCCASATGLMIADAALARVPMGLFVNEDQADAAGFLSAREANSLVDHLHPFVEDEGAHVRVIDVKKLGVVLAIQAIRWDDAVRILLNDRPVDQLSPGQRSSTMLPLVALSESVPLIIDQPEDNLDNRHVGRVLTKILAELKERRQIILATHNPNIVVGGDAEHVIVLQAGSARSASVKDQGCIDDGQIIGDVIGIMEGGAEAFRARERRYADHL